MSSYFSIKGIFLCPLPHFTVRYCKDRLCGLVVRVPDYRTGDSGFDFRRYHIFRDVVDLEWGPFSLVRITEELLERKCSGFGL
jgi:hypothetical protein